jgi:hypothetical protein
MLAPAFSKLAVLLSALFHSPAVSPGIVPNSDLDLVRIETFDFAFRAPATARSGFNRIRVVNRGPSPHHVELTKVPDTSTVAGLYKAYTGSAMPAGLKDWGGPNVTAKGDSSEAIVELKPGRYSVTCWVTGANKKEHVMSGMMTLIDVKRAPSPSPEPKADIVLRTSDYRFDLSAPLTRGAHLVRFENDGPQEHDVQIVKLRAAGSMKKILKWAADGLIGAPPSADLAGGATGIDPHNRVWFPLSLTPGRYAMYCFVPDRKDGKPHILHSMWKEFTVR